MSDNIGRKPRESREGEKERENAKVENGGAVTTGGDKAVLVVEHGGGGW